MSFETMSILEMELEYRRLADVVARAQDFRHELQREIARRKAAVSARERVALLSTIEKDALKAELSN